MALSGGGARGAYSAGVLRYLFTTLPRHLGRTPWPKVVSGTSVGALNGYFAAAQSQQEIQRMHHIWTKMEVDQIYQVPVGGTFATIRGMLRAVKRASFLDPTPLLELIQREAYKRTIRGSIGRGDCRAFVISATQLLTGTNTLFVDSADPTFLSTPPPHGQIIRTKLYPEHLLASAAIPLVFPPVQIGNHLYADGGLRQNAPLHPVMHGGADRILVLGTRSIKPIAGNSAEPTISLVAGKALNALTLDPVERATNVAERINRILAWGEAKYGEDFTESVETELGLRHINIFHLRPSQDLGQLAAQCYLSSSINASRGVKWFLDKISESIHQTGESDFLSHLLFDHCYTAAAEDLGFNDAKANEEELMKFLGA